MLKLFRIGLLLLLLVSSAQPGPTHTHVTSKENYEDDVAAYETERRRANQQEKHRVLQNDEVFDTFLYVGIRSEVKLLNMTSVASVEQVMVDQLDMAMSDHYIDAVDIFLQSWAEPLPASNGVTPKFGILTLTIKVTGIGRKEQLDEKIAAAFLDNVPTFFDLWYIYGLKKVLVVRSARTYTPSTVPTPEPTVKATIAPTKAPVAPPVMDSPAYGPSAPIPTVTMEYFETMVMLEVKGRDTEVLFREKNMERELRTGLDRVLAPRYNLFDVSIEDQTWISGSVLGVHATLRLTLYIEGEGAVGERPDEVIVQAFGNHASLFEAGWAVLGLSDFDEAYVIASSFPSASPSKSPSNAPTFRPSSMPSGLPSLVPSSLPTSFPSMVPSTLPSSFSAAPSNAPSKAPSITPTDWGITLHPVQMIENATVFRGTFETDIQLRLYGVPAYVPDELVVRVEDLVREFINDFVDPTPNVALSITSVELTHQWIHYGGRRLEEEEDLLRLDMTVKARAISRDENALDNIDFVTVVEQTFVTEYEECLDRLKALDYLFSSMVTPVQIGGRVIGAGGSDNGNEILVSIQPWLIPALAVLIFVLVATLAYMYASNNHRRSGVESIELSKGDELTVIPISEIDVFLSTPSTSPPASPKETASDGGVSRVVDNTSTAVEPRFGQVFNPSPPPQEVFTLQPRPQVSFSTAPHEVYAPPPPPKEAWFSAPAPQEIFVPTHTPQEVRVPSPREVNPIAIPASQQVFAPSPPPEEESVGLAYTGIPTSVCSIMVGDTDDVWSCISSSVKSTESSKNTDNYDYDQEAVGQDLLPSSVVKKTDKIAVAAAKETSAADEAAAQPYDEANDREIRLTLSEEDLDDFDRAIAAQIGDDFGLSCTIAI